LESLLSRASCGQLQLLLPLPAAFVICSLAPVIQKIEVAIKEMLSCTKVEANGGCGPQRKLPALVLSPTKELWCIHALKSNWEIAYRRSFVGIDENNSQNALQRDYVFKLVKLQVAKRYMSAIKPQSQRSIFVAGTCINMQRIAIPN
jgi:hypothetical protein